MLWLVLNVMIGFNIYDWSSQWWLVVTCFQDCYHRAWLNYHCRYQFPAHSQWCLCGEWRWRWQEDEEISHSQNPTCWSCKSWNITKLKEDKSWMNCLTLGRKMTIRMMIAADTRAAAVDTSSNCSMKISETTWDVRLSLMRSW